MKDNSKLSTSSEKANFLQYRANIVSTIGVGENNSVSLTKIIEKLGLTDVEDTSFRKGMIREIEKIEHENQDKLLKVKKGTSNYFYWDCEESKAGAIKRESPKWKSHAHAMAYSFIEDHLTDFLPPSYVDELQPDFDDARDQLMDSISFRENSETARGKLVFHPSGYDLQTDVNLNPEEHSIIYSALDENRVLLASYDSIHKQFSKKVILSPQRLVYLNHQILLLCYEHGAKQIKYFEVNRLKSIQMADVREAEFKNIDLSNLESNFKFRARVHTWVKNYFDNVRFGPKHKRKTPIHEAKESWIIESQITLPKHFNSKKEKPDPFFFANFIGIFADSMEVLEPACLRNEMIRRAQKHSKIYLESENDNIATISESPHDMADIDSNAI